MREACHFWIFFSQQLHKHFDKGLSAVVWKEISRSDLHLKCEQDLQAGWAYTTLFTGREVEEDENSQSDSSHC